MRKSQKLYFAPGPVRIPEIVKHTFLHDSPYFASGEFSAILKSIQPKLREVFDTKNPVMIGTGSGSLGMEACVLNFFNPHDEVIVLSAGKYGENWVKMCEHHGLHVYTIEFPPEQSPEKSLDLFKRALATNTRIKGVLATHVETTTGSKLPIDDVATQIRSIRKEQRQKDEPLFIIDSVCSLLTEPFRASNYDVVISASQKGLQCPPGLFFMTCSDRALKQAKNVERRLVYFDVLNEIERCEKSITTFTPASNLIVALDIALEMVLDIGRDQVIRETESFAAHVRDSLQFYFKQLPWMPCNGVSAFILDDSNRFVEECARAGLILGSGLRQYNNKIFRMMHFGWDLNRCEVDAALRIIQLVRKSWV